jgi:predicted site-specific integrase-resolvase
MKPGWDFLRPAEVAQLFGVTATTVAVWARKGLFRTVYHTLGGHSRYLRSEVEWLLAQSTAPRVEERDA